MNPAAVLGFPDPQGVHICRNSTKHIGRSLISWMPLNLHNRVKISSDVASYLKLL